MRIATLLAALTLSAAPLAAQASSQPSPSSNAPTPAVSAALSLRIADRAAEPFLLAPDAELVPPARQLAPATLLAEGSRRYSVAGGIGGFILGGAAGGTLGCLANKDDYGVFCGGQNDTRVFVGAALGAAVGAALGAVILRHH
jgi:hypothetical protein